MNRRKVKTILTIAIALSAIQASYSAGYAQARAPFPKVSKVLTQPLDDIEGREVRIEVVEFAPGAESPRHRHPGHVFVYVLEGEIVSQLEDGPATAFKAGESFYEPTNGLHAVARNPSDTESALILVFMIMDEEAHSLVLER